MSAVWGLDCLTHTEKLMLLCLADNANDQGICWPSVANISKRCSVNKSTVSEVIERLCEFSFVQKKKRFSKSTIYTVSGMAVKWTDQTTASPSSSLRPDRTPVYGRSVPNHQRTVEEPASKKNEEEKVLPLEVSDEILPSRWRDIAEHRSIPEEQIFRSWRRFKDVSAYPFKIENWKAWIAKERVGKDAADS